MTSKIPGHVTWLKSDGKSLKAKSGEKVQVWTLICNDDQAVLKEWAKHFRQHYCLDSEIDALRTGTGLSRTDYLLNTVFPDGSAAPGPSIRAGDFSEIIVADYLQYVLGYWVPRGRYAEKAIRNESVKGVDVIGFRLKKDGHVDPKDEMVTYEVKAQFSGKKALSRLQNAVDDSAKDNLRKAYTLNAAKRRLLANKDVAGAARVERFQDASDRPYKDLTGAAAVFCDSVFDAKNIRSTNTKAHPNRSNLVLLVIRGKDLMTLAHSLYLKAADEA